MTEIITWNRILPEKLTVPQLVKKFPHFMETRRFVTAFTRASHSNELRYSKYNLTSLAVNNAIIDIK
jgi:hypothetical protein